LNIRLNTLLAIAALLGMAWVAPANADALKVGVVDLGTIFESIPQSERISGRLEREFGDRISDVQQLERSLETRQRELQRDEDIMSEADLQAAVQDFQRRVQELQQRSERLGNELQRRQREEQNRLISQVQERVSRLAEDRGLDLVLDASGGVVYARESLDLSRSVIEIMRDLED
jgi:outer membrane protein